MTGAPARTPVLGERGMVATSHPLAARVARELLAAGGTAADAAVGASACLGVVEPNSTGIGGDAFALCWFGDADGPTALEGAGPAPGGLSVGALHAAGFETMPEAGPWSITVPGAVSAWGALLERYGRLGIDRVLAPAIRLAEDGFTVSPVVAAAWARHRARLAESAEATAVFVPAGRTPQTGERFANPALAGTLRQIAASGPGAMYHGALAEAVAAAVSAAGGPLRVADLAGWGGAEWVPPIHHRFRGVDVYEPPPPGQGIVVLEALGIYEGLQPADEHAAIEALKLAFADAAAFNADPAHGRVPVAELLGEHYLAIRRRCVDPEHAGDPIAGEPFAGQRFADEGDTSYVAVVDGDGGACSFIQSLYEGFGSGVCVPGTGVLLQNRGSGFVLDLEHVNRPAPKKRPYHTIVPALLARDGELLGCLGVVGGFMQPQGQMQILRGLFERGLDPQEALMAPRVRALGGRRLGVEPGYDEAARAELARRGHWIEPLSAADAGGAQLVLRTDAGWAGATDPRKDGGALAAE